MEKNYCVYKHTTPSGKVYIGITGKKPVSRWANGNGYASNKHFSNAIQKYGWENIQHEVLLEGLTVDQASAYEQLLICLYQSDDARYGYNKTTGGEKGFKFRGENKLAFDRAMKNPARRERISQSLKKYYEAPEAKQMASEAQKKKWENDGFRRRAIESAKARGSNPEYRKKLSEILTKKRSDPAYRQSMTGANNPRAKSVLQYSTSGTFVTRYDSIADAARALNANHANICACIKGRTKTAYGYVWVYDGDEHEVDAKIKRITTYTNPKSKPIIQYDLEGNVVQEYRSITDACAAIGANASTGTMHMALCGKRKTAYGSVWRYVSEEAV